MRWTISRPRSPARTDEAQAALAGLDLDGGAGDELAALAAFVVQRADLMRVAVVGAGLGGLSAAAHLVADGHEVVVYERNPEPGGVRA